jgi:hypothetical protein
MKLIPTKTIKVNEIDFVISDEEFIYPDKGGLYFNGKTIAKAGTGCVYNLDSKNILCQLKSDSPIEGVPIADEVSVEELSLIAIPPSMELIPDDFLNEGDEDEVDVNDYLRECWIACYTLANKERGYSEEEMIGFAEFILRLPKPAFANLLVDKDLFQLYIQSLPTKIFLLTDDEEKAIKINNTLKFVKP